MAGKHTTGQAALELGAASGRRRRGAVERQALSDLRTLRQLEAMPPGTGALEQTYLLLAGEIDQAHRELDRYAVVAAVRELLRVREALSPVAMGGDSASIEELLAGLPVS